MNNTRPPITEGALSEASGTFISSVQALDKRITECEIEQQHQFSLRSLK